jgi:hypothetical protein
MSETNGHTKEIFNERQERRGEPLSGGIMFLRWLSTAGEMLPPWWSVARDSQLRAFTKNSDHLSGAVYTLRDMMTAIPVKVMARDTSIKSHVRQANQLTEALMVRTESRGNTAATGWGQGYGAFVEDYHSQDNGGILAIEGPGRPDGPLTGAPTKLIHLDSSRCQRTGHREYPIIFTDTDGKRFKLHHTRVIAMASMASPIAEMYGVGMCAVSRCVNIAQNLMDIARYKQEKLGSRPWRGMLVAENATKTEVQTIANYLELAGEELDNRGQSIYAGLPVVGSKGPITLLDLASLPDGFNEMESTQLAMAVLSLAFGVDSRQFAFAMGVTGQTRADAEVQHAKMRGKGPGAIIQEVKRQFEAKVLPPHLYLEFDYQDDEQDEQQARIRETRAKTRTQDLKSGTVNVRVAREQMLEAGDLTEAQFIDLELRDGRLEDGSLIESLFFMNDRDIQALLSGIDPDTPDMATVEERLKLAYAQIHNAPTAGLKDKARMVAALLEKLKGDTQEAKEEARRLEEARTMMEINQPQQQPIEPEREGEDEPDESSTNNPES